MRNVRWCWSTGHSMTTHERRDEFTSYIGTHTLVAVATAAIFDDSDDPGLHVGFVDAVDDDTVTLQPGVVIELDAIHSHTPHRV